MKPSDVRDRGFAAIRERLDGDRKAVWEWMQKLGPRTTRALAIQAGMSILTVRPRVTELCEMGLAEMCERYGREGVYRAISMEAAEVTWRRSREQTGAHRAEQMALL